VDAGAQSVHVHAFEDAGRETLDGAACAKVLRAIRERCAGTPVSLTTSAAIIGDPAKRLRVIERWRELPELVTANQGEPGIVELCELLLSRGVAIEAGLLSADDAHAFVRSGLAPRCRRVLIEPLDGDADMAIRHAAAMEDVIAAATAARASGGRCACRQDSPASRRRFEAGWHREGERRLFHEDVERLPAFRGESQPLAEGCPADEPHGDFVDTRVGQDERGQAIGPRS
jgi:hypothetical protein